MKKEYLYPTVLLLELSAEDVIQTSGAGGNPEPTPIERLMQGEYGAEDNFAD